MNSKANYLNSQPQTGLVSVLRVGGLSSPQSIPNQISSQPAGNGFANIQNTNSVFGSNLRAEPSLPPLSFSFGDQSSMLSNLNQQISSSVNFKRVWVKILQNFKYLFY